jgi:hypothetical protein
VNINPVYLQNVQ